MGKFMAEKFMKKKPATVIYCTMTSLMRYKVYRFIGYYCDLHVIFFPRRRYCRRCPVIIKIRNWFTFNVRNKLEQWLPLVGIQYINCQGFGYFDSRYLHFFFLLSQQSPFMISDTRFGFGYWRRNLCLCTWNSFHITNLYCHWCYCYLVDLSGCGFV